MVFEIEYPVTRTIRWRWLGPISFLGAFIAIVLLTVLNVALVGYETVNIFSNDFMATQNKWYHTYMPYRKPKPGSLCDPHLFNVGDRFTTNYTMFEWSVQSIDTPNAATSGVSYNGSALTSCDVAAVYVNGDLTRFSVQFSIVMSCRDREKFGVTATTSFTVSALPGIMPQLFGIARLTNSDAVFDPRAWAFNELIRYGADDIGRRSLTAFNISSGTTPVLFSTIASFDTPCPASSTSDCGSQRPIVTFNAAASVGSNGILEQYYPSLSGPNPVINSLTEAPLLNIVQTIYAGVRIDLGIDSPNNFILHKEALPLVLNKTFPVTPNTPVGIPDALNSQLYTNWDNARLPANLTRNLPLKVSGPADVQLVYLCRHQKLKSPGSLVISVLVAVLSMFSSGWGIYMLFLTTIAKRNAGSNSCEGHLMEPYQSINAGVPEKCIE